MNGDLVLYHYNDLIRLVGPEAASLFYEIMEQYSILGDPDTTMLMEIQIDLSTPDESKSN